MLFNTKIWPLKNFSFSSFFPFTKIEFYIEHRQQRRICGYMSAEMHAFLSFQMYACDINIFEVLMAVQGL